VLAACAALLGACALMAPAPASATTLPSTFAETAAFSGLTNPTVVRFAPDGRVYVAEKSGLIKTFDSLSDPTPTTFADLRTQVHNFWDRGLLGMSLAPAQYWGSYPWVYVNYTHDAAIGGAAPRWGTPGATSDGCPSPPGATSDGCVVSGRVSVLKSTTGATMSQQQVLVEDWCQQYPSHSIGGLEHDRWGELWASGGDGASFTFTDWGQDGNPTNPCGDPPVSAGGNQTPPTAQGGALRSQDLRTPAPADPTSLDGTLIRINANNGLGVSRNPLIGSNDLNERRIVAYGLRNPFRFALPKHLTEAYVGDVGWNTFEEINRFSLNSGLFNFGWPCYEGNGRQSGYDGANLSICENLYNSPSAATQPLYAYNHASKVVPGETCPTGSSSIAGLEFYYGPGFPTQYEKALFFADYSRDCIWVMSAGADGRPVPSTVQTFAAGAANPVNLELGPDGALYYPDFDGGRIMRIAHIPGNQPPTAVATADPTAGPAPLTVQFSGSQSSDPDGDPLTYAWDLDGDTQYDDSTAVSPTRTYTADGNYPASLKVTDDEGLSATAAIPIDVGESRPIATITSPAGDQRWRVGERFDFAGSATDQQDGVLPETALDWELILHHCPSNCHQHPIQSWSDTDGGNAADHFFAPDHEYPSHLELKLTATDSAGLKDTKSVLLDPRTVNVTLTSPPNTNRSLTFNLNGKDGIEPFTSPVIEGSTNTISTPSPQVSPTTGFNYKWTGWKHGGARTQTVVITAPITYTAQFLKVP
jgi:PKD repeat protein